MSSTFKKEIKEELLKMADIKYKEFHGRLCPGTENIIGIRVPVLRKFAKELSKKESVEDLLKQIDDEYYEEIMLKGMLIGLEKEDFEAVKKHIKEFVPKIDNWAVCDVFCAGLKITNKNKKEMLEFIQEYLKSSREFEIRFGIVMILDYYIEKEYLEEIFKIFNSVKCDEYYVQMAVAWAVSICLIKFYNETLKYLKTSNLDKFTYNKALQKAIESYRISNEKKLELRRIKGE